MKKIFLIITFLLSLGLQAQQPHSGGIEIATGFKLLDGQPIDDRFVVNDSLSLTTLPNLYDGAFAVTLDEHKLWIYNEIENKWERSGKEFIPSDYDLDDFTNESTNPFIRESDLEDYVPDSRTITLTGTTNQVNISGNTQDLSTDRIWTFSLPQNIHSGASPTFNNLTLSSQLNVGNLRLSGNSIQSTDTNGNITITPNGTGKLQYNALAGAGTETNALFKNANNEIVQRVLGTGAFANIGDYLTISSASSTYQSKSEKGVANGYAPLNSSNKIPSSYLDITGADYLGTWNADTNTPTIIDGTGSSGDYYRVTVAGTQDLGSGNISFTIGDDVRYNGTIWERVPSGQSVVSVNGFTGVVELESNNIPYDNTDSGMAAIDVKEAIDELRGLDLDDLTNLALNRYVRLDESLVKLESNMTFTVGVGKDFETIGLAVDAALNYYPNENYTITILIDENFEHNETLNYTGLDFSHIVFSSTGHFLSMVTHPFSFTNCWLPIFNDFKMTKHSSVNANSSRGLIFLTSTNLRIMGSSELLIFNRPLVLEETQNVSINGKFSVTGASARGIYLRSSSARIGNGTEITNHSATGISGHGIYMINKSNCFFTGVSSFIDGTNFGITCEDSTVGIFRVTLSNITNSDITIDSGGIAVIYSGTSDDITTNIPVNILNQKGIIFDNRASAKVPYDFDGTDYTLPNLLAPSGQEYNITIDDTGKLSREAKPTIPEDISELTDTNELLIKDIAKVLDAGDTATDQAIKFITASNDNETEIDETGLAVRKNSESIKIEHDKIIAAYGSDSTTLSFPTISGTNVIDFRNSSGTVALTSDIPAQLNPTPGTGIGITGTYPNLTFTNTSPNIVSTIDQVLGAGSTATSKTLTLTGGFWTNTVGSQSINIGNSSTGNFLNLDAASNSIKIKTGSFTNTISKITPTQDNNHQLPDKSGIIAHISDIQGKYIDVVLDKARVNTLHTTPVTISDTDLGLASGQSAKIMFNNCEVKVNSDGVDFSSTRPIFLTYPTYTTGEEILKFDTSAFSGPNKDGYYSFTHAGSGYVYQTYRLANSYQLTVADPITGGGDDATITFRIYYYVVDSW
jgi:hypothetical protein